MRSTDPAQPSTASLEQEERSRWLDIAVAVGNQAGEILLEGYRKPLEIRKKGAIDLVTDYDLRAEAFIREGLGAALPEHRIVGEEGANEDRPQDSQTELVWYVDPLDGTTNFAHGHPFFCVSIGLYRGDEPEIGVIVAPALGHCWRAARGLGAFRDEMPCTVSRTETLSDSLCASGFPYDKWTNPDRNVVEVEAFLQRTRGIRRCGSAALDLALVSDGTYDLYWEQRLNPWDLGAGAVLVSEAGGRTTNYEGGPFRPTEGRIVASNGKLHDEALGVLQQARASLPR